MKAMRHLAMLSLTVLAVIGVPRAASATCHSSINVTTTVYGSDLTGNQLLLRSDDYNGTGVATYSAALNTNTLSDIYGCNGQWFFELYRETTAPYRTIWMTPNDPYGSQPAGPPPGYYWQDVELVTGCYDQNGNGVYLWAVTTSSGNCDLRIDFYSSTGPAGAQKYKLVMGSKWSLPGATTGLVTVTCNQLNSSTNECVRIERFFFPNMCVDELATLAAYAVRQAHELNPMNVDGLDVAIYRDSTGGSSSATPMPSVVARAG
jgi:hypothetical protein